MPKIYFKSVPFSKEAVTLALESGVDGVVVDAAHAEAVRKLALCDVFPAEEFPSEALASKADEERAAERLSAGETVVLRRGWEIIPVENLLAGSTAASRLGLEAASLSEAKLAAGVLERGVPLIVALPEALGELKRIVNELKTSQGRLDLEVAKIVEVRNAGLGHRVCVDTLSLLERGQGMLVGDSSAFTFLVHAETERNEYVAARPFRVNAGGVHAYVVLPGDRTCYLEEVRAGDEALIVSADGSASLATVGRVKTEVRPMLMIRAETEGRSGAVFLQNAETIRLTRPDGSPASVVDLRPGDEVLCRTDAAGRHFGMRVQETIREG